MRRAKRTMKKGSRRLRRRPGEEAFFFLLLLLLLPAFIHSLLAIVITGAVFYSLCVVLILCVRDTNCAV